MTLTPNQLSEYRELKDFQVDVSKHNAVRFNAGGTSETIKHSVGKHLAALVGLRNGYRVDSEVSTPNGETDVLLWGHPERLTYSVEIETGLTEETKQEKYEQYVKETCIDDIQYVEATAIPMDMGEAYGYIATELGFEP